MFRRAYDLLTMTLHLQVLDLQLDQGGVPRGDILIIPSSFKIKDPGQKLTKVMFHSFVNFCLGPLIFFLGQL